MAPLHVCLLGASGRTGVHVISQALDKGYKVKAVVRNPDKIKDYKHENLEIASANIFDAESLAKVFEGVDAVISTLGFGIPMTPDKHHLKTCKAIVDAMNKANVKRLVLMLSWFTSKESRKYGKRIDFFTHYIGLPIYNHGLNDMNNAEEYLKTSEAAKGIEYTIVSPADLLEGPKTHQELIVDTENHLIETASHFIRRSDVAGFIIKIIDENIYVRQNATIAVQ